MKTKEKCPAEPVTMTELVLPSHTNAHGNIFGGVVMSWIDIAGAIAAGRYARSPVVTVSIDHLHFITPIRIGYAVRIYAIVSFAGKTSMEVDVTVESENSSTGEVRKATRAFLTYVAVDEFGRPRKVPPYVPQSEDDKKKMKEAEKRRFERLRLKELFFR